MQLLTNRYIWIGLFFFVIVYFYLTIRDFFKIISIVNTRNKLSNYLKILEPEYMKMKEFEPYPSNSSDYLNMLIEKNNKSEIYSKMVALDPEISDIIPFLSFNYGLSFDKDSATNISNAAKISRNLLDLEGQTRFDFIKNRNPIYTLRCIFLLPTTLLSFFGINITNIKAKNLLSFIAWFFLTITKLFSEDIKNFIIKLLG